ncbi:MAG: PD-(D/E)XK nuclease family protein [Candidatus Moraniibacteriota bacterium]
MSDVQWLGEPLTISNSEIQTWKTCRRKWYLVYYRQLGLKRTKEDATGARQLGTKVHIAMEAMYREGENPVAAVQALYEEDIASFPEKEVELRKELDLATAMLEGYLQWITDEGIDDGMELDAAECIVEVESGVPGVKLRGKLDQRWVRKIDGARLFRDFKTVGEFTTPGKILAMDEQMKFYHLLEYLDSIQKTGKEPMWRTDGALYTMLRKVKRTATAKPPFYSQIEVHHNITELRTMLARTLTVLREIVESRQRMDALSSYIPDEGQPEVHHSIFPPRPSRDCTWGCDFFPVCPMMDDGSNYEGLLREYYTHVDPHERYKAQDAGKEISE